MLQLLTDAFTKSLVDFGYRVDVPTVEAATEKLLLGHKPSTTIELFVEGLIDKARKKFPQEISAIEARLKRENVAVLPPRAYPSLER